MLIALSFAEVSSRFDATGGPYLYTRAAFGRFAAFEVGWMLWFTRAASWAAVINVLATAVAFYAPALASGWPRAAFITSIIVAIAAINIRGIRQSSLVLNVLTVGKLFPLVGLRRGRDLLRRLGAARARTARPHLPSCRRPDCC